MWSSIHTLWYLPKGIDNVCLHKSLHKYVCSTFIPNFQNPKAIMMSLGKLFSGGGMNRLSIEDFYTPETILYSTIMVNIYYTFFTTHKMYNTKNEP